MKVELYPVTETFSFSRALHLMKYAGAKVRIVNGKEGEYLYLCSGGGDEMLMTCVDGIKEPLEGLYPIQILSSWEIYREELHGVEG